MWKGRKFKKDFEKLELNLKSEILNAELYRI